jgi:hypothetical protein
MIGIGLLNIGSLVLGLIAWILPLVSLTHANKVGYRYWVGLSIASVSACAASLCMQIFYTYYLVKIEDWSALMDTTHATSFASLLLFVITIILNLATLFVYNRKNRKV